MAYYCILEFPCQVPVSAELSSSSSSSSSDEEDSGSETTPTPTTPAPRPPPPQRYPARPRTPSSIDEEEEGEGETPLTPESMASSLGSSGSGLRLTISKALLPLSTVQHLGGRGPGDKGQIVKCIQGAWPIRANLLGEGRGLVYKGQIV